ncbi:putative membrane protein YdjX (TVP38/TMEM64 family) [Kushneria sinocarnis]|uniref:TVP38/TMEM64 family membrane protein n=1 Tax=Kushneria sinocarnis TaxID=595502 RepID=A0A420WZP9_9GAMM|nr:TVP38/TMEM64 family protein [Kushneria sinocarnis]RKR06838.1 putative membrane protein YdjX (TVP38/TMEM64 family) [Kushneria sinocarnis]
MSRRLWLLITIVVLMIALGCLWQWLTMGDTVTPEAMERLLADTMQMREAVWAPVVLLAIYPIAAVIVFPLTVLVGATGLIFGPWWGTGYALAGTMCSSIATYWLGRALGRDVLARYGSERIHGMADALARHGIRTMIIFNLLPLAPFTFTNMVAGACRLRFSEYLLGSIIGIAPGLIAVTVAGSQLGVLLQNHHLGDTGLAIGALIAAVAVLLLLRHLARRRNGP